MDKKKLLELRLTAFNQAKAIDKLAQNENRELTEDETKEFNKLMAEVDRLNGELSRMNKLAEIENELSQTLGRQSNLEPEIKGAPKIIELRKSVVGGSRIITIPADSDRHVAAYNGYLERRLSPETRATLQADSDIGGGFLLAPLQMQAGIIQNKDDILFLRQICNVLPPVTSAESLGVVTLEADPDDPTIVGELDAGEETTAMEFGMRELTPHPIARRIKLSEKLLRKLPAIREFVLGRLAYRFARREEYLFLYGTGAQEPLGMMVDSTDGISNARDVNTGNEDDAVTFDGLKSAKWALKPQYRQIASWIFPTAALTQIDRIKDGEGRFIWQPSVTVGVPDRLLNLPLYESSLMTFAGTTATYAGILGDFSQYDIVDALTFRIKVIDQLYAETEQIGYFARQEVDGMPILAEAFVRVKLA